MTDHPHSGGGWPTGHRAAARRTAWYDSPWRIAGRVLTIIATTLIVGVVCALFVAPKVLGGTSLTVLTGSMEPTLAPGDVVAIRAVAPGDVCSEIAVGDVVTYFPEPGDPTLITHRVTAKTIGTFDDGTRCRLITQGDANSAADEPVTPAQVRGRVMYSVPGLGWVRQWVQQNPLTVLFVVGVIVVGSLVWGAVRPPRTRVVTYGAPGPSLDPADLDLRERELALREREVAVREAELGLLGEDQSPTWRATRYSAGPTPVAERTARRIVTTDP